MNGAWELGKGRTSSLLREEFPRAKDCAVGPSKGLELGARGSPDCLARGALVGSQAQGGPGPGHTGFLLLCAPPCSKFKVPPDRLFTALHKTAPRARRNVLGVKVTFLSRIHFCFLGFVPLLPGAVFRPDLEDGAMRSRGSGSRNAGSGCPLFRKKHFSPQSPDPPGVTSFFKWSNIVSAYQNHTHSG